MPMKWSRRAGSSPLTGRGTAAEDLVGDPAGRVGLRQGARGGRHRAPAAPRRRAAPPTSAASRAGVQLGVGDDDVAAPASLHPGGVGALVVGGRVRVGHEDRRPAGRGDLEDRAAGAAEDEVGGGEAVAEVGLVGEQRVAVAVRGRVEPRAAAPRSRGCPRGGGRGSRAPRARRRPRARHC